MTTEGKLSLTTSLYEALFYRPLLTILLVSIGAIRLYTELPRLWLSGIFLILAALFISVGYVISRRCKQRLSARRFYSYAAIAVVTGGVVLQCFITDRDLEIGRDTVDRVALRVLILREGKDTRQGVSYEGRVLAGETMLTGKHILLYADNSTVADVGDVLCGTFRLSATHGIVRQTRGSGFGRYLLSRGIAGVARSYGSISIEPYSGKLPLRQRALQLKNRLQGTLKTAELSAPERSAAATICLGRGFSDVESITLQSRYNAAGAAHLLAVSGFHVGIVAMFLFLAFSPLKYLHQGDKIVRILVLLGVWGFALIAGLTEPVVRAALMLTLLLLGRILHRPTDNLNLLSASALVLLIFNPYTIYSVGFLLSYAAVFSIIIFYPSVYGLIPNIKNPVLNYLWGLISISLSVQFFCMPLCLHFFGVQSVIGILTNIPLALAATLLVPVGLLWMASAVLFAAPPALLSLLLVVLSRANTYLLEKIQEVSIMVGVQLPLSVVFLLWAAALAGRLIWQRKLLRQGR